MFSQTSVLDNFVVTRIIPSNLFAEGIMTEIENYFVKSKIAMSGGVPIIVIDLGLCTALEMATKFTEALNLLRLGCPGVQFICNLVKGPGNEVRAAFCKTTLSALVRSTVLPDESLILTGPNNESDDESDAYVFALSRVRRTPQ